MVSNIKYPAAYSEGHLVEIASVTEKDRRKEYFCISCGAEMHPVLGKKREHFFRHSGVSCSWDCFIHKYAEEKIKEAFYCSDKFFIPFNKPNKCPKTETCLFYKRFNFPQCDGNMGSLDLKRWYDTCDLEKSYTFGNKEYIADLLLTSSKNEKLKPLFIEIFHTHKCTDDKRNSGINIIEIKIDTVEDVKTFLCPARQNQSIYELINFKQVSNITDLYEIQKASFTKDERTRITCDTIKRLCSDKRLLQKTDDSLFDILAPAEKDSSLNKTKYYGHLLAIQKGLVKDCRYCKYYTKQRIVVDYVSRCRVDYFPKPLPETPCEKYVLNEIDLEKVMNKEKSDLLLLQNLTKF